jgi:tRNA threonylcarbamoyladenosine biosynthesis protein TsaB
VAKGPGSFNGLRIGMSLAKGFALALNIPMVGISTLEVEAYPYAFTLLPICPIQNAGRGEIATALFRIKKGKWCRLVEEHIATVDSLLPEMKGQTIFCGIIPQEVKLQLKKKLGHRALIIEGAAGFRRAGYLAELGWRRLKISDSNHSPTLEPLYLRRPSITTSRKLQNLGK